MQYHRFLVAIILTVSLICFFVLYTCSDSSSCFGVFTSNPPMLLQYNFSKHDLDKSRQIDREGNDVLVYLHIQKTGGASFGRHLVHNLEVDPPCICEENRKKCHCVTKNNRIWLFSRHSTGWMCGLHADWTELTDCVDQWFHDNDVPSRKSRRLVSVLTPCHLSPRLGVRVLSWLSFVVRGQRDKGLRVRS